MTFVEEPITAPTRIVGMSERRMSVRERYAEAKERIEDAKQKPGIRQALWTWEKYWEVVRTAPAGAKLLATPCFGHLTDANGANDVRAAREQTEYWRKRARAYEKADQDGKAESAWEKFNSAEARKDAAEEKHLSRKKWRVRPTLFACTLVAGFTSFELFQLGWKTDIELTAAAVALGPLGFAQINRFGREVNGKKKLRFRKQKVDDKFIIAAFRALPDKEFRAEDVAVIEGPFEERGKGWSAAIDLPGTATIDDVIKHRARLEKKLGAAVGCLEIEGDPIKGGGYLVVRLSNKHASERKAQQWPGASASSFSIINSGLPIGQTQMAQLVHMMLIDPDSKDWSNLFAVGKSRSGKTEWLQALVAGAQMDPIFRTWIYEGKGNNDFSWFYDAAEIFVTGDAREDDAIALAGLNILKAMQREVSFRSKILAPMDESKVTPELARNDPRLRPILVVLDEMQEVFAHPVHGGPALELARSLITRVAAFGIIPVIATQTVNGNVIPWAFVSQFDQKIGFRMGDQTDVLATFGVHALKRGMDCSTIAKSDRGAGLFDDGNNRPARIKGFLLTNDQKRDASRKAVKVRGGVATKIDVNKMFEVAERDDDSARKKATSGKYKHLLEDILEIETDDAGERLQCQEILDGLPNRPEYEQLKTISDLTYQLRDILGTERVRLVKKVNQGKGNKPGVWKGEIRQFQKGAPQ